MLVTELKKSRKPVTDAEFDAAAKRLLGDVPYKAVVSAGHTRPMVARLLVFEHIAGTVQDYPEKGADVILVYGYAFQSGMDKNTDEFSHLAAKLANSEDADRQINVLITHTVIEKAHGVQEAGTPNEKLHYCFGLGITRQHLSKCMAEHHLTPLPEVPHELAEGILSESWLLGNPEASLYEVLDELVMDAATRLVAELHNAEPQDKIQFLMMIGCDAELIREVLSDTAVA